MISENFYGQVVSELIRRIGVFLKMNLESFDAVKPKLE